MMDLRNPLKAAGTPVKALLTNTVTIRRTTPRILFSSFLSVSVPFKPWSGSQVASCNKTNNIKNLRWGCCFGLTDRVTEARRKTEHFKAKPQHPSPEGGPQRGESCIYRQHSSIQEISSASLRVLLAVTFLISHKPFTVLLQNYSDTSKIKWYKLQRCHRHITEAAVGNVTWSIPPKFGK